MKPVFEIETVELEHPKLWRVEGRAYEDVAVGEVLVPDPDRTSETADFLTILKVSSYGAELSILDKMLTGCLTLEASSGRDLSMARLLYRLGGIMSPPESHPGRVG